MPFEDVLMQILIAAAMAVASNPELPASSRQAAWRFVFQHRLGLKAKQESN